MQFDKGVNDILHKIGGALQDHLTDMKNKQKKYIETYNAVLEIPLVKELLNENEKLKTQLSELKTNFTEEKSFTSNNISLEIKDIMQERQEMLQNWEETVIKEEEEEEKKNPS